MKPINIEINPKYKYLSKDIMNVPETFDHGGRDIRIKRNQLKEFQWKETAVCIKSFKKPIIFNQFIYTYFRMGKAKRSFNYAQCLLEQDILSPEPIAYIEQFNRIGWLTHSYYLCIYEPHLLRFGDLASTDLPPEEKKNIIYQLVEYVNRKLYGNHILNRDFNGTNILVNKKDNHYTFSLVDINRIRFDRKINRRTTLSNLNMVSKDPEILIEIAKCYAEINKIEPKQTIYELFFRKYIKDSRYQQRKRITKPFKSIGKWWHKEK